jgi:hypothetical protein
MAECQRSSGVLIISEKFKNQFKTKDKNEKE